MRIQVFSFKTLQRSGDVAQIIKKTIGYLRQPLIKTLKRTSTRSLSWPMTRISERLNGLRKRSAAGNPGRSGKSSGLLNDWRRGDRIIVSELSRLGRSMLEIMEMLPILNQKGICIYAVRGGWELNGPIQSKVMAMAFSIAGGNRT